MALFCTNNMSVTKQMPYIFQELLKLVVEELKFGQLFVMAGGDCLDFLMIFQYRCVSFTKSK